MILGPLFAGVLGAVNTITTGSNPGGGSGLQNKEEAAYPSYQIKLYRVLLY